MRIDLALGLSIAATAVNGAVVGATLDQSIKQLPARHRIGSVAYTAYAKAADFTGGLRWYPALAAASVVTTLGAAGTGLAGAPTRTRAAFMAAAAGTVGHLLITACAAPTFLSIRDAGDDEQQLAAILDRFARLQALRAGVQVTTAAATVWALATTINAA